MSLMHLKILLFKDLLTEASCNFILYMGLEGLTS